MSDVGGGVRHPRRCPVEWSSLASVAQPACFLIADISGYTGYLAEVELDHAQDILADLVGAVVTALRPDFRLAKLEGDAAFTSTPGETHRRLDAARHHRALLLRLPPPPPRRPPGDLVRVQRVRPDPGPRPQVRRPPRRGDRPAGRRPPGAARVGRDRRPPAAEERRRRADGIEAYALLSQACIDAAGLDPVALGMRPHLETYDRIGEVPGWVHDLDRALGRRRRRARVSSCRPTMRSSSFRPDRRAAQVAWEFLTTPGQRMSWQPWVTEVDVQGATGGRRGPGSANHCMHGKDAVVEEILDWRPYDYVTDRTILDTPSGPSSCSTRSSSSRRRPARRSTSATAAPKTKREQDLMAHIGPAYGAALESGVPEPPGAARRGRRPSRRGRRARAGARRAAAGRARWPASRRSRSSTEGRASARGRRRDVPERVGPTPREPDQGHHDRSASSSRAGRRGTSRGPRRPRPRRHTRSRAGARTVPPAVASSTGSFSTSRSTRAGRARARSPALRRQRRSNPAWNRA